MRLSFLFLYFLTTVSANAQKDTAIVSDTIFFDDFNDNGNEWVDNNKHQSTKIENGIYYLAATGHAYGEGQEIKIDTHRDFEIETRIKITSGDTDHRNYYSMIFWGREGMDGFYFTFAGDAYASIQSCDGKNQSDCIVKNGSLQKTWLEPAEFNIYTIRKLGNTYSFLINGKQFYQMPFTPFFGNLTGFGAGRKVALAIDYLKVVYL